ncbi:universal stress protein, partial [Saccharomonospora saliphila]|uniref:universal stress protein n=1 Tax=Saccharomonospora saliphila TaxID=369829 RepID=UPI00037B23E2
MTRTHQLSEGRGGIMACYDGSDGGRRALWWAAREASGRQCPLVVVQSMEWDLPSLHAATERGDYNAAQVRETVEEDLDRAASECRDALPGLTVFLARPEGPPEVTVPELADELDPQLVVAGASGRGALARMLLGSTAAELARALRQAFVVVRGEPAA